MKIIEAHKSPSHDAAHTHVQGLSEFIDDRPAVAGELHVGVVYSPHPHARIVGIDPTDALAIADVVAVFTARDVHHNLWGPIFQDQPLVADTVVSFVGEVVALVAAETREAMEQARRAVRVSYEVLPAILSIPEAIAAQSFLGYERFIRRGDVDAAIAAAPHKRDGVVYIQGQDHFYLESHAAIAYPRDGGQIEVHASSQHPTEVQHIVAHGLGLRALDVVCVVKRMGGGFGGKESQAALFAFYASLVAHKLNRPARCVITKDDDMIMTGKRNPFEIHYRVGFDSDGALCGLDARLFSDGGAFADLSTSIMERAMLHSDNAYFLPAASIVGKVCKTHVHPHTAFRGFGGPKGVAMIEAILEDIAHSLEKDPLDVRKRNVYSAPDRNVTHYGQPLENLLLPELFDSLESRCDYRARRASVREHNAKGTSTLRGLSLTAVKFGISFTTRFLNQGNALVNVHQDGTVQVSTGATEMGQGVNTRIAQVVAEVLGIAHTDVRVMTTSTEKNHNTSPTAASSGTDLNAKAALDAVTRIRDRLSLVARGVLALPEDRRPSRTAGLGTQPELAVPEGARDEDIIFADGEAYDRLDSSKRIAFGALCREAYLSRVQLGDYGFFKIPGIHFDKLTGQGSPFFYFTQGTACSEIEIDRYTGELKVLRVDLLMDLGRPINHGLDVGQVIGAFVQGMGWCTSENLVYDDKGLLLSHSPSTYKIPSVQDTPRDFRIELIENHDNLQNVRGTKAVGEPPLLLGLSVWTAVRDALYALAPVEHTLPATLPMTLERILLTLDALRLQGLAR
ncbi:MAG: molybdopterin-dependent oxidoreductase [Deltaproteobacteria bacterium]|nr:molybdopterin-dependent oxidoreductase [Deltaproteobacteria bacterium]